ncbi:hypothetical protein [Shewanella sp. S1-58-MNA-CIBAN-0166]|uniref:hypothetical protein n=1 Tax=Shewanella sp. S1-58-MNA-CIBAN-0166 TaxID=3140467 RepID=UPI00332E8821
MSLDIMDLVVALSVVATAMAGLISGYSSSYKIVENKPDNVRYLENRINELKRYLKEQQNIAKRNQISGNLLTIGQYIVGGLLATSFIQEQMSSVMVGILGLIVLFSSTVHQKFRPDLKAAAAQSRATKLKQLLRRAQDLSNDISLVYKGKIDSQLKSESTLAASIGMQMDQIENEEIQSALTTDAIQYKQDAEKEP